MNFEVSRVKIFVTVPETHTEKVRTAICNAGAGIIGNYTFCTCSSKVLGTFIPNAQSNPTIGEINKLQYVNEEKIEAVCEIENVKNVINAIRDNHPYEEPAIDIFPLIDESCF